MLYTFAVEIDFQREWEFPLQAKKLESYQVSPFLSASEALDKCSATYICAPGLYLTSRIKRCSLNIVLCNRQGARGSKEDWLLKNRMQWFVIRFDSDLFTANEVLNKSHAGLRRQSLNTLSRSGFNPFLVIKWPIDLSSDFLRFILLLFRRRLADGLSSHHDFDFPLLHGLHDPLPACYLL